MKPRVREVIVVEGRYDKNTLLQAVDAVVVETGGFAVFRNGEKAAYLRRLAEKYPDQIVKKDRQTFTVPKRCVSVREPYSAERRKAASERAKAAGYRPPVPKAGGK